jgi:hypothetical protein
MDRVRDAFLYFVAGMSMLSLLLAVYQAMNNSLKSAGVLAAVFFVSTMIVFIPQLEVLKAFGVEAKLREKLNEADVIIAKLNRLSALSAKVSYTMMAWGNRFDGPSAKDRQAIIDEVDRQIADLKLTPEQRRDITGQYVSFIGLDLLMNVNAIYERYSQYKSNKLNQALNRENTDINRAAVVKLSEGVNQWAIAKGPVLYAIKNWSDASLNDRLDGLLPVQWMNETDLTAARQFQKTILAMYEVCQRKGGYTPEAAEYNDKYRDAAGIDAKMKELFGVSLNDL